MLETFEGKEVEFQAPAYALFNNFSDLTLFKERIPAEYRDKVVLTKDSVSGEYNGMNLTLKVVERIPYSRVVMKPEGFPMDFSLVFNLADNGVNASKMKIAVQAQMNFLTKQLMGRKIQELVDKISDNLASYV
ncbi:MAG: hypothetical protein J6Z32_03750 [Bacteroidales bacterium]|nr:hypothetical protein [Bacteroidales bacterium]